MFNRNTWMFALLFFVMMPAIHAAPPSIGDLMNQEKALNKGNYMDAKLVLRDRDGAARTPATEIKGPATVVGVSRGCEPCDEMLTYLRTAPAPADGRSMVVVQYGSTTPIEGLPAHVKVYYTAEESSAPGILQSSLTPTTFFFSSKLQLLGRRSALFGTAEHTLVPPNRDTP